MLLNPAGIISPASVSRLIFALFIFDQVLFGFLGEKYC
jgi:hypothetical protein